MNNKIKVLLLVLLLLGCTSCDLSTKWLAKQHLQYAPAVTIVTDYIELRYTQNEAIAFSMLSSIDRPLRSVIIYTTTFFAFIILGIITYQSRQESFAWLVSLTLILSGAIGNLVDRILNGHVVDFIHLHYAEKFNWPIFNIADVVISCGAVLLAILMLRKSALERKLEKAVSLENELHLNE